MSMRIAAAVAALMLAAAPAQAVITSITLTSGTAFAGGGVGAIVAQPTTFAATGNNLNGFNERQNIVLAVGNAVAPRASLFAANGTNFTTLSNIVSPVRVSSHFFYLTRGTGLRTATGEITFNQNVIAIQRARNQFDHARSAQLHNGLSNFNTLGGAPGTEDDDTFIRLINPKKISFSLSVASGNSDSFRVLTAVPEPSSWLMMIAGFGLVGLARRRSNAVVAA